MIVSFAWPTSASFGGGVDALFRYADGLARRGHEVHLVHGPKTPDRISHVDEVGWFTFHPSIQHHVVDDLLDPGLPAGDVCFPSVAAPQLGQPAVLIQGYRMLDASFERPGFRARCPKFCVATWLTEVGVAWGSPPEQMLHVPLGIDHDVFRVDDPAGDRPIDVAMLYSTHPVKGGDDGLAALREVHRRRPGLRVELFGMIRPPGPLPDFVTYRTAPDRAELARAVYNRTKVFVQPSLREGFGLTSVEAMACGAALVTTDNGGSRDFAAHDRTAAVVPRQDPGRLAEAVEQLLADDDRRARLAHAGGEVARTFRWEHAAEVLEGHLLRYLEDPTRLQAPPRDAPTFLDDRY